MADKSQLDDARADIHIAVRPIRKRLQSLLDGSAFDVLALVGRKPTTTMYYNAFVELGAAHSEYLYQLADRIESLHAAGLLAFRDAADAISDEPASSQPAIAVDEITLSPTQRAILQAMIELEAMDSDRRCSADDIARVAIGKDGNNIKRDMTGLKINGLVDSITGRGGGSWLTPTGINRAQALNRAT